MKLVLAGGVVGILGLIFPWARTENSTVTYTAFSAVCGAAGWFIAAFLAIVFITLFSYDLQEKTKKYLGIILDAKVIYMRMGWMIALVTLVINIALTGVARTLGSEVQISTHFGGMIWTSMSAIFLII